MFDKIGDIVIEAERNNEVLDIKNLSFSVGKCNYKVLENGERMKIIGINKGSFVK